MTNIFCARGIRTTQPDFSDARLSVNNIPIQDIITFMEECGYGHNIGSRRKKKIDELVKAEFNIGEKEIKLCKLIASLKLENSVFYRQSRSNDEKRSPLKIVVDENLSYKIVTDLMMQGLYISHVYFEDLGGKPDKDVWNSGADIIITHDNDFENIAEMMYIKRCCKRGTEHVDTRDFPMVIIVDKKKIDKDIFLSAFRKYLPEIIGQTLSAPRLSLFGTFHSSGALTFTPHDAVFKSFIHGRDHFDDFSYISDDEAIKRKHFPLQIDSQNCLLPGATLSHMDRVRHKAKFTRQQFNIAANGPIQPPVRMVRDARAHLTDSQLLSAPRMAG